MFRTIFAILVAVGLVVSLGCGDEGTGDTPESPATGEVEQGERSALAQAMEEAEDNPPAPEANAPAEPDEEPAEEANGADDAEGGSEEEMAEEDGAEGGDAEGEVSDEADGNVAVIEVTANDQMQFNIREFEVRAGQPVRIELTHTGQLPKAAMGHNMVILVEGVDLVEFAIAATAAQANDYIPQDREGDIIAHTELLGGGESDTIEFTAPEEPGTRKFLCSFPGHFATMQGDMIVTE